MPRGSGGRQQSSTLHFEAEFDFETSNAQFDKVQIEKELKEKLTLGILPLVFSRHCRKHSVTPPVVTDVAIECSICMSVCHTPARC